MDVERERHRRYHGAVSPENHPNLSTDAGPRKIVLPPDHPGSQGYAHANGVSKAFQSPISRKKLLAEMMICHLCQLQHFRDFKPYPVTITNTVDNEIILPDFKFIEDAVLCDGVERADDAFRLGCDCEKDDDCLYQGCQCLQDLDVEDRQHSRGRKPKLAAYISSGPDMYCLRDSWLNSREPIYECHESCHCSEMCINRVVERGRQIPLDIFRTSDGRGWGVRSTVDIAQGQFVDRYIGEIITGEEAQKRREESDIAQRKDVYLFALDKFSDPDSHDPRLAGEPFEVDGEFMAGPTRFINHSCDPNLRIFARVGDHADKHIHDLAFFAIEDIPAGTELTFDYVDGLDDDINADVNDENTRQDMIICLCGSKNCRGFLW